jgi:hypothetical protein
MARTQGSTADLELTRVPGDRRLYHLAGIGTLRLQGLLGRNAVAAFEGGSWTISHRGFWQRELVASDETGALRASFEPRSIRRGGTLRTGDRELILTPSSSWRERYELAEHGSVIASFDAKGWGKRPVRIAIEDPARLEPGLALFATFVVHGLAESSSSSSGAGAAAAVG